MSVFYRPEIQVFEDAGFAIDNLVQDKESAEYHACAFSINTLNALYRQAKITPTKNGQFVTVWKRMGNGPIQPFDMADGIDLVIVRVNKGAFSGCFIFPTLILCKQKIFTNKGVEGKRAFRVYPPWDVAQSKQATATQKWQLSYFLKIKADAFADVQRLSSLLVCGSWT